jgi:hypothetical protein
LRASFGAQAHAKVRAVAAQQRRRAEDGKFNCRCQIHDSIADWLKRSRERAAQPQLRSLP